MDPQPPGQPDDAADLQRYLNGTGVPDSPAGLADAPRLPGDVVGAPAMAARPIGGPLAAEGQPPYAPDGADESVPTFSPLATDPPPRLASTWWLRLVLFGSLLGALASTMYTEYTGAADDIATTSTVIGFHILAAATLVIWSFLTMHNAQVLVPPTRYQQQSRGWLIALLWIAAFATPAVGIAAYAALQDIFDDPNSSGHIVGLVGLVMGAFILVWLPFRYFARHAARIGAPHSTMNSWFWIPLIAVVAGMIGASIGLSDMLAENGVTALDRTIQVGLVYGAPMLLFALSTWRAVTVFDEVLDLRWHRWKREWEQTMVELAAQPGPGPEASPSA